MSALDVSVRRQATTLARCWRIERTDGSTLGLTDHDEALEVDGTRCEPIAGTDASTTQVSLGLAVEDAEIVGALSYYSLDEGDLERGLYDGAEVRLYLVDWCDPAIHARLATYVVGEVTRMDGAFRAELRGIVQRLERPTGRRFSRACDAELGDERCGVALDGPTRRTTATVTGTARRSVEMALADPLDDAALAHGEVLWTTGANEGTRARIVSAEATSGGARLALWDDPVNPVANGDEARVTVGCDKAFATCHGRFANADNFRGFPHLPGNDFAFSYAGVDGAHDGGPLVR